MIDLLAVQLALRNRALSLVVCTTGSTTLSATATGYHRPAGSFAADGFVVGMEIVPTGFAANTVDVIVAVTASDLTTMNARTVEVASAGRSIVVGLPALRAWENQDFPPVVGRHYLEEDFTPGTHTVFTATWQGGGARETGLYVLKWYAPSGFGVAALRKSVDALRALLTPGTSLVAGANTVRVNDNPSAQTGQVIPLANNRACLTLTVPWYAETINTIAA